MQKNILSYFIVVICLFSFNSTFAQSDCSDELSHGAGFYTSIESVDYLGENALGQDMHTIVIRIENDGCTDPDCKSLNQYSVEALAGTYSDIFYETIEGDISYGGINFGPSLGGVPFEGFRIANINGIGNGIPGVFTITYTLTGGLQDQRMLIKASDYEGIVQFYAEDFQTVLNCDAISNIIPYYANPENGRIENSLIGAELTSLYETFVVTDSASTDDIFQIVDETKVVIDVFALAGQYDALLSLLQTPTYGMTDVHGIPGQLRITGVYPILNLLLINDLTELVNYARNVYPGDPQGGIVTSQGDTAMLSFIGRNGFNVDGDGIKIGVLSDSYNTKFNGTGAGDDIQRGDLPGPANAVNTKPIDVLQDYPYGVRSDEGRAMLQIIHDIAPKAELAFRTGLISPPDFALGIKELQLAGCDVIVDDITYISEPFLEDGVVAQAVNEVVDSGVVYVTAAGNFGNKSYENAFNAGPVPVGLNGPAHNFAAGTAVDIHQSITVLPGSHILVIQWDDGLGNDTTSTDLDIYLANDDGSRLFGFNRDNRGGAAIEVMPYKVLDTANTNIVIVNNGGPDPVNMKYIVFSGNIVFNEYFNPTSSTIVGQANSDGALTVGAVYYGNTPAYGVDPPTIASFSSTGGTLIEGNDRAKPEVTAPNGVNTTVDLGGPDIEQDLFPNFFGTSASAPHVAGLAALLLQAKDIFYDGNQTITPAEMKSLLMSTAVDMESPGFDYQSGAGMVNAVDALLTLASPSPLITDIVYDTSLVPGEDTIYLSVVGQYLTEGSEIYFNGTSLGVNSVLDGDTISGIILPFDERYPNIQVYNPPNPETNGTDGGLSNSLYFTTKPTIIVDIADTSKKYAEVIPEFSASYTVETIEGSFSLEDYGLTTEEINRIHGIPIVTVASDTSNVGLWPINPSADDPLNPLSVIPAVDPLDTALLYNYTFEFHNGLMNIEKMDITIIPKDTVIVFGDTLYGFDFYYIFNNDTIDPENNVTISDPVYEAVLNAVSVSHATALVNVVASVSATALVNASGEPLLDSAALTNVSFFISNAAVGQSATALVNGTLLDPLQVLNAASGSTATALVNGTAVSSATALVNGSATVTSSSTATALVNVGVLTNAASSASSSTATALVNGENINEESNSDAVVILDESDILILSGDSIGEVEINSINLITGTEVGVHYIVPGAFISNNFNSQYALGEITVIPDTAEFVIDPASLVQVYDGGAHTIGLSTVPENLELEITYDGDTAAPVFPGTYSYNATVLDTNYTGSVSGSLQVVPASATITADLKYMHVGDSLPEFTATFDGFVNGEDTSVLTSLSFSLSPAYAGVAGIYDIIPSATADNYIFTPVNGVLYVNPSGPGIKHIKSQLQCVEELAEPNSLGHLFIAYFEYENDNGTPVYIPIGPDNELTGEGSYNGDNQPEVFLAGGGSWSVSFDGGKLTWTVASFRHNGHKTSVASNASSTSSKCNKSTEFTEPEGSVSETLIYPNPVSHTLTIERQNASGPDVEIIVYDIYGKQQAVAINGENNRQVEIGMSGLRAGVYFIKIQDHLNTEVLRVIKQ